MTSTFWIVYYICLLILDAAGIVSTSLKVYDDVMKIGKIRKTNVILLVLWIVAFALAAIGFSVRFC